jgi:hypothetical protein
VLAGINARQPIAIQEGTMKGDFSRRTFDPEKHFSRVLMQQGRVHLDADWNEQAAIQLHLLRTLVQDIVGPHGGPADSFEIRSARRSFRILPGHYYVGGILCELDRPVPYTGQPNLPVVPDIHDDGVYLAYLDVWERHISYLEDEQGDEPGIREVALGGADTATRAKVVWQVKTLELSARRMRELGIRRVRPPSWEIEVDLDRFHAAWQGFAESQWQPANRGRLKVWARVPEGTVSPSGARYVGAENRLYRVEIHGGGEAGGATFKWSRENGSVVFPILSIAGKKLTLGHLGHDSRFDLKVGNWVEIVDDDLALQGQAEPLRQVAAIDRDETRVKLSAAPATVRDDRAKHPLLRRWDHGAAPAAPNGLHLDEASGAAKVWVDDGSPGGNSTWHLEDGVHVEFCQPGESAYRSGDYWLMPARTVTADVEWPGPARDPAQLPPRGVAHYYAPLAVLVSQDRRVAVEADCRLTFEPVARPVSRREE